MQVANCQIVIDDENQTVTTTFQDGTTLVAKPNYDEGSNARAEALGYSGEQAVWKMNRDHDLIHALLAEALELPHSPTLWSVAHERKVDPELASEEERIVFLLQRISNIGIDGILKDRN